jgi:GAF domain-containing protein
MESRRLFSETEKRAEELAILNEMGQALASQMDMNGVIESVYRHSARLIGSDSLYVALYDEAQDEVAIRVYGEGEEAEGTTLRRVAGKGITEHVIKSRQPLLMSEDVGSRVKELGIETHGRLAESWLGVPMMTGNQVSGIIAVQSFNKQLIFDEHHRDLLTAVASQAAIAIENARLFAQVQARARRERILQELTARVRGAADVDTIMRTAAQEVGQALGREAFVYISKESTDQPEEDPEES